MYPLDMDASECRDDVVDSQLGIVEPDNSTTEGARVDTALHVRLALQSQTQEVLRPIWETGIWNVVFGQSDFLEAYNAFGTDIKRPAIIPDRNESGASSSDSAKRLRVSRSYTSVVKVKQDVAWEEQQIAFLQSALKLWYITVA